ncbi:MAG: HAD-IA family hydrolase [Alphaproteobacteria bacterium]|nr:HAD-IA family hydrolase [Alphaproteobacteria bacterium]MCB9694222.1 HAD-IA family hydrolase [Alphaproteobacteria bacterium]
MQLVLFDLDGTLVHSIPGLVQATNALLAEHGRRPLTAGEVQGLLGHGAPQLLDGAARLTGGPFAKDPYPRYVELCLGPLDTPAFDGIPELLDALADRQLAVITNKPEGPAFAVLDRLGWRERFLAVVGGDTLPTRKPDPAGLLHVLDLAGCTRDQAVYIGDSDVDVAVARRAGIPSIGVGWGYGDVTGADLHAQDVPALGRLLGV